jgi:hypothetical protein
LRKRRPRHARRLPASDAVVPELLRQPDGFDGLGTAGIEVLLDDLSVAQGHHLRGLLRDRYSVARTEADRARERAKDSAEREREKAERGREYEQRYRRERGGDVARERTEREDQMEPDR